MKPILKLEHVTKMKDKKLLVEDLSFDVYPGEIFGFLGPNGAGKTTTIKMITGLYQLTQGEIYIEGHSVKTDFEKALQSVGAIIENPEMYGYLSGYDNLVLYARMHGEVVSQRVDEVIKLVKLENRIHDKVKKYSLGMRQRLGLAQALLHQPKLLILDEPTNGLDPVGIKDLRETLRELCDKQQIAVIVSSHLLSEMELMCDRFCIIDGGKFVSTRTLHDEKEQLLRYELEVSDVSRAVTVLKEVDSSLEINALDYKIRVSCEKTQISQFIKQLVLHDIEIFEVVHLAKTLEDEFMSLTNGSKTQIR